MNPRLQQRAPSGESGAAVTEAALLALILIPTLIYAIYMYDMSHARLRASEIARYVTWELTAMPLSDYQSGNHRARFDRVRNALMQEMQVRYGDDLDGATPWYTGGVRPMMSAASRFNIEIPNGQGASDEANGEALGCKILANKPDVWLNGKLVRDAGFNVTGHIWTLMGIRTTPLFWPSFNLLSKDLETFTPSGPTDCYDRAWPPVWRITEGLFVDAWDLKDGRSIDEIDGSSDFSRQVDRVAFPTRFFAAEGAVISTVALPMVWLGNKNPTRTVVRSLAMPGMPRDPHVDLDVPGGAVSRHYTSPFTDIPNPFNKSEYYNAYKQRGAYYLGCPKSRTPEGACW